MDTLTIVLDDDPYGALIAALARRRGLTGAEFEKTIALGMREVYPLNAKETKQLAKRWGVPMKARGRPPLIGNHGITEDFD